MTREQIERYSTALAGTRIYVPPPPDIEPLEPDDPFEGVGALAWGVGALLVVMVFLCGLLAGRFL